MTDVRGSATAVSAAMLIVTFAAVVVQRLLSGHAPSILAWLSLTGRILSKLPAQPVKPQLGLKTSGMYAHIGVRDKGIVAAGTLYRYRHWNHGPYWRRAPRSSSSARRAWQRSEVLPFSIDHARTDPGQGCGARTVCEKSALSLPDSLTFADKRYSLRANWRISCGFRRWMDWAGQQHLNKAMKAPLNGKFQRRQMARTLL